MISPAGSGISEKISNLTANRRDILKALLFLNRSGVCRCVRFARTASARFSLGPLPSAFVFKLALFLFRYPEGELSGFEQEEIQNSHKHTGHKPAHVGRIGNAV